MRNQHRRLDKLESAQQATEPDTLHIVDIALTPDQADEIACIIARCAGVGTLAAIVEATNEQI